MKLGVTEAARLEECEAAEWYSNTSREIVTRFRSELKAVLRRVRSSPQQFPFLDGRSSAHC